MTVAGYLVLIGARDRRFRRGLRKGEPMRLLCQLVLASITLFAAGAGWAEQREARLLRGPMTETPIIRTACDTGKWNQCIGQQRACAAKPPGDQRECEATIYYNCTRQVPGCE